MQQFARDALLPGTGLWLLGYPGFIKNYTISRVLRC